MGKLPLSGTTPGLDKTKRGAPERMPTTVHDIRLQNALIQKLRHVEPIPGMHLRFKGAQSLGDSRKRLDAWLRKAIMPYDD